MRGTSLTFGAIALATLPSLAAGDDLSLRLLGSIAIADASEGFDEPSDLSLDPSGRLLWSVSDDTRRIFALGPEGDLDFGRSVSVDAKELEGIAVLGSGERMLAVKEDTSEVLTIEAATGRIVERRFLSQLPGFEAMRPDFDLGDGKGLEGITVNPTTGDVYVIKEGEPRLLIELAPDLSAIKTHHRLTAEAGFRVDGVEDDELDVSGIAYDVRRDRLWIVSDVGRTLFLYDAAEDKALGVPLTFRDGEDRGLIKNAEGVALNASGDIVFVITDDGDDSSLYSYEVLAPGNCALLKGQRKIRRLSLSGDCVADQGLRRRSRLAAKAELLRERLALRRVVRRHPGARRA